MTQQMSPSADEPDEQARHDRVEELISELAAPMFQWRMARGTVASTAHLVRTVRTPSSMEDGLTALQRSARTRMVNAEKEIDDLVSSWFTRHHRS